MRTPIDTIINELYTLDPTLREYEGDVRVLVTTFLDSKPDASVSTLFLTNLRRELLTRARAEVKETEPVLSTISWWAVRLVPIGAIAILTLALIPEPGVSPTTFPMQERSRGGMETSSDALFKASEAPSRIMEEGTTTREPIVLSSVVVERGGFVVIHVSVDGMLGEIVGVSRFLTPGTTVGVQVNFLRGVSQSESIVGVFYPDNGDGVFKGDDTLSPGTPLPLN